MSKYKVIALYVGADSGKVLKFGDIVSSDAWGEPGRAEELREQGFLEVYTGKADADATGEDAQPKPEDPQLIDQSTNEAELGLNQADPVTPKEEKPATKATKK